MKDEPPLHLPLQGADGIHIAMRYFKGGKTYTRVTYMPDKEFDSSPDGNREWVESRAGTMYEQLIEAADD